MLTRQEKIDTIYEKIARKDLSFGCSFLCQKGTNKGWIRRVIIATIGDYFLTVFPDFPYQKFINHPFVDKVPKNCVLETIGHPVMIGDVMDWIEKNIEENGEKFKGFTYNGFVFKKRKVQFFRIIGIIHSIYSLWKKKRLSLEEQSDECIDFIYNLIS